LQAAKKNVFRYQREIIVLGVSLFVFTVLLGFSSQLINRWATFSIDKQTAPISKGIEESLQYVSEQRQAIITSRVLDSALVAGQPPRRRVKRVNHRDAVWVGDFASAVTARALPTNCAG